MQLRIAGQALSFKFLGIYTTMIYVANLFPPLTILVIVWYI